jgi:hypothetical protein
MAFGGAFPPKAVESMFKLNVEFVKLAAKEKGTELNPEQMKKYEQAMARMSKGVEGMSFLFRTGKAKDNDAVFARMVGLMKVTDSAAYLANYEKLLPELTSVAKDLKLPFMAQNSIKKKSVGGINVLEVTTDVYGGENPDPAQKKIMEAMFGPGGKMKTSLAALDGSTVIMSYTAAESLRTCATNSPPARRRSRTTPTWARRWRSCPRARSGCCCSVRAGSRS